MIKVTFKKDYSKDFNIDFDGVYGNTLGDNKENYFDKLTKERD